MGIKLVAFDRSESSRKALNQAVALMKPDDELFLLMVVPSAVITEFADVPPDVTLSSAQQLVNAELEKLKQMGVKALGIVKAGDFAEEILKMSSEMGVDLIVIGYHGLSKVGRFAVGAIAEQVYKRAERPVLIVK